MLEPFLRDGSAPGLLRWMTNTGRSLRVTIAAVTLDHLAERELSELGCHHVLPKPLPFERLADIVGLGRRLPI